jgi:hypothetical protein
MKPGLARRYIEGQGLIQCGRAVVLGCIKTGRSRFTGKTKCHGCEYMEMKQ